LKLQHESDWRRIVIESVYPEIDGGRFPIKRIVGDMVEVEADVFSDGHDQIACYLLYRPESSEWSETPMRRLGNDRWRGSFQAGSIGRYRYTIEGWVDHFRTWQSDLIKRLGAGQDVKVELLRGAEFAEEAAARASGEDAQRLADLARLLRDKADKALRRAAATGPEFAELMDRYPDRRRAGRYDKELVVVVDRAKARFSTWYEVFPRSCSPEPGRHGTLCDCEGWLPYIAAMNFDVLYLPPVHPIGRSYRKGKNNTLTAQPEDVGSPWAIGSEEGGHKSIHPQLGTLADLRSLIEKARGFGLEIAMDIAFQCTPDHPYVREHPEWFRRRPDGTVQYAENPPKKYQDIYPLDFETEDWRALWEELKSIFLFWIAQGVNIFRVDNPHTKPFAFWEWVIGSVKQEYPDVIFLAEAFTRPRVMERLAKAGFSQSYTYFAWRNSKTELTTYFRDLTGGAVREYLRPNLWPNTPDILPEYLQVGGRPAFMTRLALAATLGANYGIYGPAFELCENTPREPGSEEYLNSEKYEIKHRDLNSEWSLKDFISRINLIRRENPALQSDSNLWFHESENPMLVCYSKSTADLSNLVVVVVNLDSFHTQAGWVTIDAQALGLPATQAFQAHDLLSGARYLWQGPRNYIELDPQSSPAHILRIRKRMHSERDFDYYL